MRAVGVDTYSYHRRLGEVRPGESVPIGPQWSWQDALDASLRAAADVVALETCFMGPPSELDIGVLRAGAQACEVMLSWGHPYGLEYGSSPEAESDLLSWLDVASRCGHAAMRIVVGHAHVRDANRDWEQVRGTVDCLGRVVEVAAGAGVVLAIENHTDVTAEQLAWLLEQVSSQALGVCFDTANAIRIGDDVLDAARLLAPFAIAVHAKDIAAGRWHPTSGPRSVPLGSGVLPVERVVRLVAGTRPDCRFLVELAHLGTEDVDEEALVEADIAWLRTVLY